MNNKDKLEIETILEKNFFIKQNSYDFVIKGKNNWYLSTPSGNIKIIFCDYSHGIWSFKFHFFELKGQKFISEYGHITLLKKESVLSQLNTLKIKIKVLMKMYKNNIISKKIENIEKDFI